jgi:putative intracellular protease/amidase
MTKIVLSLVLFTVAIVRGESLLVPAIAGPWTPLEKNPALQTLVAEQDRAWHFTPAPEAQAREPFTVRVGPLWHSYYSGAHPVTTTVKGKSSTKTVGAVFARTSPDLKTWGKPVTVAWGGASGEDPASAGHPCVVEVEPGHYYLFRTQTGEVRETTCIYHSTNPLDFGTYGRFGDALHFVTSLPAVVETVVRHSGNWFAVRGGEAAKLEWRAPAKPSRPAARPAGVNIRVALYDDSGSAGRGIPAVSEQLGRCTDIEVTKLDADGIRAGLDGYDVVIFTGGSGGRQANMIGLLGREQVRRFVEAGGGYVGICAGAYLACDGFLWGIKVLDAKTPSPKWERGGAELKIESTADGQTVMGLPQETTVKYHNGPLLVPANNPAIPDFEPLTFFRTEVAKNGSPAGIMVNSPAIVRGQFGAGRVIVCSPHPEQTEGLDRWIEHTVRTVAAK